VKDNNKGIQTFRTLDAVGVVVLIGIVATIVGAVLSETFRDDRPARAHSAAKTLAHQIMVQRQMAMASVSKEDRSPASISPDPSSMLTEGQIGKDPWGRPYHYFVKANADGSKSTIFVWSDGPNGKPESTGVVQAASDSTRQENFHFQGDDLGHVQNSSDRI
jgi:hypothetical protein